MKSGTENRTKTILAVALMAIALIVFFRKMVFPSGGYSAPSTPAQTTSAPPAANTTTAAPARTTRQPARNQRGTQNAPAVVSQSLDPRLRLDLLKRTEETKYTGSGRNIFSDEPPPPPAPKLPEPENNPVITQQGPPPPPPINLKFFGFASRTGTTKKIFLSQGEDVFVASEGDIVQRRYKILRINPTSIDVEDVLTNNRQTIPLTAG